MALRVCAHTKKIEGNTAMMRLLTVLQVQEPDCCQQQQQQEQPAPPAAADDDDDTKIAQKHATLDLFLDTRFFRMTMNSYSSCTGAKKRNSNNNFYSKHLMFYLSVTELMIKCAETYGIIKIINRMQIIGTKFADRGNFLLELTTLLLLPLLL